MLFGILWPSASLRQIISRQSFTSHQMFHMARKHHPSEVSRFVHSERLTYNLWGAIECQPPPLRCLTACRLSHCIAQSPKMFTTMVFQRCHETVFQACHPRLCSRRPHKSSCTTMYNVQKWCFTRLLFKTVSKNCLNNLFSKIFTQEHHARAVTQMPHKRQWFTQMCLVPV